MASPVKKKLLYQTLAFILPLAVLPIFITGLVLTISNHRFFEKTIHQDYANILQIAADAVGLFITDAQSNLENLALVTASVKLDAWGKEMALTAFLQGNPQFLSINLVSAHRTTGVAASPAQTTPPAFQKRLIDQAMSGKTAVSAFLTGKSGVPHLDMAVPVHFMGKVDEVLCTRLSFKFIWDILEKIRIGKTGAAYIMDMSGCPIAHRDMDRVVCRTEDETPEFINRIKHSGKPEEWEKTTPEGAFYHLGVYIPELDWVVAIRQPKREVYAMLYGNIIWAALITILICVGVTFRGWMGTRRLLVPIRILHHQVRRISQGHLDQKISIYREDEIGDLGNAFNKMTVSLKRYLEQEIESARTLAQTKNLAALGTVASKVSHEMGNFLFGLQMMLAGLKKEPLSQQGQNSLKTIENEMARTRMFIHAYKNFAKKPALSFTRRTLDGVIREVLDILKPEADERNIAFALNWTPSIPPLRLDAGIMHQAFTNLVKNSLEAMGGGPGTLTITGKAAAEQLLVSVRDTGSGMDAETLEKLFEPFFSTKGILGTGLGLPNVKSGIEAHGGTIECVSKPGEGAEFLIRLPLE